MQECIVIDNESQAIYVNGKKWEKSPEFYTHLRDRAQHRCDFVQGGECIEQQNPGIKMYQSIQAMGAQRG